MTGPKDRGAADSSLSGHMSLDPRTPMPPVGPAGNGVGVHPGVGLHEFEPYLKGLLGVPVVRSPVDAAGSCHIAQGERHKGNPVDRLTCHQLYNPFQGRQLVLLQ